VSVRFVTANIRLQSYHLSTDANHTFTLGGGDFGGIDFSKLGGAGGLPDGLGDDEDEDEDEDDDMPALEGEDDVKDAAKDDTKADTKAPATSSA